MADDGTPFDDIEPRHEYSRVAIALACIAALMLVIAVLPVISPTGTGSPLAEAITPPQTVAGESVPGQARELGSELTRGRLGALNPGQRTDVGGSIGTEDSPFRSQNTQPHFTVESTEPAYWRTGTFDSYTGSGWEQSGTAAEVAGVARAGREVTYEVTLAQQASALPAVWQPRSVSLDGADITDAGTIRPERAVPAGTQYSATSVQPVTDPELLRASGTDYPAAIERQYTELPDDTQSELAPFTAELTSDDETPYDTARTIEAWLERTKSYSLNVSDPSGDDVATDFVFDMEQGYCEYFATAMVAMLRSQDIPARYVVGYSTGEATGENEYTIRGMNAHAWVEVYFEDTGWVKFDPTPGSDRLQQERQSMTAAGEDYSASEQGSPGEEFSVGNETGNGDTTTDRSGSETESGDGSAAGDGGTVTNNTTTNVTTNTGGEKTQYTIELNRTAVPGAPVAVTVSRDDSVVPDATVFFNDRAVGTTNERGSVVATVPFATQLNISVAVPDTAPALGGPTDQSALPRTVFPQQAGPSTTVDVATNATVRVVGDTVTNGTVTVTATVNNVSIRDAVVSVGSRQVATTGTDGTATVSLPSEPGQVTITVRRRVVSGTTTVTLPRLSVETKPTTLVALPGVGHRVNATLGTEPAANATVAINGNSVVTTDIDGIATPPLPFDSTATIAVSKHGQRRTATVAGLYRNLAGVAGFVTLLLAGSSYLLWQRGPSRASVAGWVRQATNAVVSGLVWLGGGFDTAIRRAYRRLLRTLEYIGTFVLGQITPAALAAAFRAWLDSRINGMTEAVRSVRRPDPEFTSTETHSDDRLSIRDAWQRFVGHVSIERYRTRTPGEIAAHAVAEDGLPADAVRTIRDAFRAVEYGQREPGSQLPAVEAALDRIDSAVRGENGEGED